MQHLFEYLIDDICNQKILEEESLIYAEDIINESFKCELLSNLAANIKKAEKKNNAKKIERSERDKKEYGYSSNPNIVSFASIFGPITVHGKYSSTKGIQGLKWSEITEDDFTLIEPGNEKALKKALKQIYAKNGKGDAIICMPGTKNPVCFIKGYGKTDDKQLFFFDYDESHWNNGVRKKTAKKYTYQERDLKLEEVIPLIADLDVYILNVTDEMITQYKTLFNKREEEKQGMINYDEASLKELLKKQQARYKVLAAEIRAKKLQKDPSILFDEIKEINDEVVDLYREVMSSPENLDQYFDMGSLMSYVSYAYESFYKSMKSRYEGDQSKKLGRLGTYYDERANEEINDVHEYLEKIKKEIEKIKKNLK